MPNARSLWLRALTVALADLRATLASFGHRDRPLERRIDAALAEAYALIDKDRPC